VLRQEHPPGEKLFVGWAGATLPLYDPETGGVRPASLFVAVLEASNYTYAEASEDQQLAGWIGVPVRTFEFFGSCPQLVVPDNLKTGVNKACRYEPDLNPTYQEMAMHYGVGVLPARPRKPCQLHIPKDSDDFSRQCGQQILTKMLEVFRCRATLSRAES
jgi:transposase